KREFTTANVNAHINEIKKLSNERPMLEKTALKKPSSAPSEKNILRVSAGEGYKNGLFFTAANIAHIASISATAIQG
ncbi:MAG: hypothetical protein MSA47_05420, partial [Christensenellaceae bacterium]|nr:hypothetical protein [Christensenellaceae bacterium]